MPLKTWRFVIDYLYLNIDLRARAFHASNAPTYISATKKGTMDVGPWLATPRRSSIIFKQDHPGPGPPKRVKMYPSGAGSQFDSTNT